MFYVVWNPWRFTVIIAEIIPVTTTSSAIILFKKTNGFQKQFLNNPSSRTHIKEAKLTHWFPNRSPATAPIVITPMWVFANENTGVSVSVSSGVPSRVLIPSHRILLPSAGNILDEVYCYVLPVVAVWSKTKNARRLLTVPKPPNKLYQEMKRGFNVTRTKNDFFVLSALNKRHLTFKAMEKNSKDEQTIEKNPSP